MRKTKKSLWMGIVILATNGYTKVITAQPIAPIPSVDQQQSSTQGHSEPLHEQHSGASLGHTQANHQQDIVLPYFTVGASQPEGYIPSKIAHQVFMLFSPSCPHCLDFITAQLPILRNRISKENVEINIGFNPLNPIDLAAIKIIVGTFSNDKKIYNEKKSPMVPLDMLKILMEKRTLWLDTTIEVLKTGKKDQVKKAIDEYVQTITNEEEKNNWLAILDPADELTYLKIFCGQELGLDPNYIQECIDDKKLSEITTVFPSVVAKGDCNHAPFFSINGQAIPDDTPFTDELLSKRIQDSSQKKEITTKDDLKEQLKKKIAALITNKDHGKKVVAALPTTN